MGATPNQGTITKSYFAGFWRRCVAFLIDGTLLFFVIWLIAVLGLGGAYIELGIWSEQGEVFGGVRGQGWGIPIVLVIVWFYDALMTSSPLQATPGKVVLSVRVTDYQGVRVNFLRASTRHFGKYLSIITLGVGFMMAGFTTGKQALHDKVARTLVEVHPLPVVSQWLRISIGTVALAIVVYFSVEGAIPKGHHAYVEWELESAVKEAEEFGTQDARLAAALNGLAMFYTERGKYTMAEPLFRRSLAIAEDVLGPHDPSVAAVLLNLAWLYHVGQGRYADAQPLFERALEINEAALEPGHPRISESSNNLALLYVDLGEYSKAEPLLKRALDIEKQAGRANQPAMATILQNYIRLLHETGRSDEATQLETYER